MIAPLATQTANWSGLLQGWREDSQVFVRHDLPKIGEDARHDPALAADIVSDPVVPGVEKVGNGEAEYLLLIKTLPSKQYAVKASSSAA